MLSINTWFSAVAILERTPFYLHFGRNFDPIVSKKSHIFVIFGLFKVKIQGQDEVPEKNFPKSLLLTRQAQSIDWDHSRSNPFPLFSSLFCVTESWFCWNFMNLLKLYHFDLFKCHWYLCWCIPQGINCANMYHWWYFRAVIFTN